MFLTLLCLIGFSFLYFYREAYISELIISFLPYIGGVLLIMVIYWLVLVGRKIFTKKVIVPLSVKYSPIFLILCCVVFFLYFSEFRIFYNQNFVVEGLGDPLKIMYANIYKDNKNFSGIIDKIEQEDPDVVMFVEFSDEHEKALKDFAAKSYVFYDKTNWSKIYGGSVVVSKYPITNFNDEFVQEDSWKYGYYMINKNDEKYYFYLVHTSSPVTDFDFQKRNQQLITIKKDYYTQHEQSRDKDSKIIMLGDFNVSPWSIFYKRFAQSFPLFENITRSKAVFFSWNGVEMLKIHDDFDFLPGWFREYVGYFPIVWSHIDHVFVSNNVHVADFRKVHIDGSDHEGIVFSIQ